MADNSKVNYVDTNTAIVKMTGGVPFTGSSPVSDSDDDDLVVKLNNHSGLNFHGESRGLKAMPLYTNTTVEHNINSLNKGEDTLHQMHHQSALKRQFDNYSSSSSLNLPSQSSASSSTSIHQRDQGISNDIGSSSQKLHRNKDDNENETSSHGLESSQIMSERTDRNVSINDDKAVDTPRSIRNSRSLNDIQQKGVDSNTRIPRAEISRAPVSSSKKHKQSSEHLSVTSLREHARLSQSLENSQVRAA